MKTIKWCKDQSGAALVVGIVLLVVATLLALVAMQNTAFQERMSSNQYNKTISLMAAEFGAGRFLEEITEGGYDEASDASQWGLGDPQAAGGEGGVFWVEILNHVDDANGEPLRVAVHGASRTGLQDPDLARTELHLTVDVVTVQPPGGASSAAAINLVGPLGEFSPPNSQVFNVYGAEQGDGQPPGPAVGVSRQGDQAAMECKLGSNVPSPGCPTGGVDRLHNYHGGIATIDYSKNPSDPDGEPNNFWTDPSNLQTFVDDVCAIAGSRCGTTVAQHTTGRGKNKAAGAVPKITVVRGDAQVDMGGGTVGAGLLIVEGNLTMNGNPDWDGVIISLGGQIQINGGGNTQFNGTIYSLNIDTKKTVWEKNEGCARRPNGQCWKDENGNDIFGLMWRTAGGGNADYRHNCAMVEMAASLLGPALVDESTDPPTPLNARAIFDANHGCGPAGAGPGVGAGEPETRFSIARWVEVLN